MAATMREIQDILECHVYFPDLRDSTPATCVSFEEAAQKARKWKMAGYFETSALLNDGVVAAFKQCVRRTGTVFANDKYCARSRYQGPSINIPQIPWV